MIYKIFAENYSNSNTEAANEISACQIIKLLQCYGMQFMKLVLFLIFLYAWNNQMTNCYFMNSNCQLTNAISDLLNQCLKIVVAVRINNYKNIFEIF